MVKKGKSKSKKKSAPKTIPSSQGNPVGTIENSLDASTDDYEKTDNSREGSVSPIDPPKDRNKPTLNTTVPEEQDQPESSQTNQSQTTHSTDQQDTTPTETQDAIDTHPKNAQEPATDSSAQFTTTGIVEPPATPTKDDPSVENLATKEPLNTIEIEIPLGTNVDQSPVESLNESKTPADVLDRSKERKDSRQSDSQQFEIVEIHSEDGDEVASNESTHNQSGLYASSILENSTYSFIDTELEPEENIGDKSGHTDAIHASENMEIPSNVIKKESKNTSDVEVGGSDKEHDQLPEQTEEIQNITKDTAPSLESNKPNAPEAGSNTVTNALSFAEAVQFSNSEKGTMSDKVLDGAHDSSETKETPGDIVSGNLESTDKAHKDTVSQPHQTEATVDITDNTKNTSAEPIVPTTHAKDSKPETFAEVVASSSSSIPDTDQQHKDVAPKEPLEEPTTNSAPTDDPKETFAKVVASSNTPAEESHKEITPEQADKNDDIPTENTKPETFAKIAESSITNIEESHKENVPVVVLVAQPKDIIADDTPADKHTPEKTADKSIVSEKSLDNSIEASECSLNSSEIDGFSIVRSKNPESNEAEQYQQPKDTKNTAPVADDDDDDSFVKVKSTKHSFTKDNATPTGSVEATNWLSNHPRTEEENVAVDNNPFGVLKSESPEMTQSPDHGKDEQEKEDIHDKDISTHQFIGKDLEHTDDSIVAQEVDSEPIKENDVQKTDVQETEPTKVSQKEEKKEIEPHSEPKSEKPSIPTHGESSLPVTTKGTSQPDDTEKAVDPTPIDQLSSKPVSTEQTPAEQDVVDQATEESTVEKDLLTIEKSTVLKDQSDSNEESTKEEESLSDGGIPKEIQSSTSDEASEQAYMSDDEQTESGLDYNENTYMKPRRGSGIDKKELEVSYETEGEESDDKKYEKIEKEEIVQEVKREPKIVEIFPEVVISLEISDNEELSDGELVSGDESDNFSDDMEEEYRDFETRVLAYEQNAPKDEQEFFKSSHEIFKKVQNCRQFDTNGLAASFALSDREKSRLSEYAGNYNALLESYIHHLAKGSHGEWEKSEYLKGISRILRLCEILYFSGHEKEPVVFDLSDWLNTMWPLGSNEHSVTIGFSGVKSTRKESVLENEELISRHILRGNLEEAADLLKSETCLSREQKVQVDQLIKLIKTMPKLSFDAKPENVEKWSAWHRECVKSCHGYFNGPTKDNPLYNLFMILAGDTDTIEAACSFPETMIAVLIYSEPFHLRSDLAPIARRLELPEDVDQVTEVCYYVMGRSWDDVLERCGDSWLETHLGHLLLTAEFLPDGDDGLSSDREQEAITEPIYYVIHDYAENLVSKYQMWREAVDYLSTCRVNREVWIEQLFGNPPLEYKSLDFVKEMLEFSKTNNMNKVQRCLYKAIAGRHEAEGESYEAAVNYARAGDRATLDLLANNILQGYLTNGTLEGILSAKDRTNTVFDSKEYAFLVRYSQFREFIGSHKTDQASKLLTKLSASFAAPEEFRSVLLVDSLPFLKSSPQFNQEDTYNLMRQFAIALQEQDQSDFLVQYYNRVYPNTPVSDPKALKATIHSILCRNLALAMIS